MKLYYGAYRIGNEKILKVSDDVDCLSPQTLAGTYGMIESSKTARMARQLARIAKMVEASAIEFDTNNDYKVVEVR